MVIKPTVLAKTAVASTEYIPVSNLKFLLKMLKNIDTIGITNSKNIWILIRQTMNLESLGLMHLINLSSASKEGKMCLYRISSESTG